MKKSIYTLLALLVVSVLPGCGKSSNNTGTYGVYGGAVFSGGGAGGTGCYNLNQYYQTNPNAAFQGTFAGQGYVSPANGSVQAVMYGSQTGMPGANYARSNSAGDSIQMYVAGNQAIAAVTLSPATVAAIVYYRGGQLCGVYVNSYASGSTLTMSAPLLGASGNSMGISI
jgi:hypothetical protein